ncbi:unnamed protein product, partial [Prorocentrum cordatum]
AHGGDSERVLQDQARRLRDGRRHRADGAVAVALPAPGARRGGAPARAAAERPRARRSRFQSAAPEEQGPPGVEGAAGPAAPGAGAGGRRPGQAASGREPAGGRRRVGPQDDAELQRRLPPARRGGGVDAARGGADEAAQALAARRRAQRGPVRVPDSAPDSAAPAGAAAAEGRRRDGRDAVDAQLAQGGGRQAGPPVAGPQQRVLRAPVAPPLPGSSLGNRTTTIAYARSYSTYVSHLLLLLPTPGARLHPLSMAAPVSGAVQRRTCPGCAFALRTALCMTRAQCGVRPVQSLGVSGSTSASKRMMLVRSDFHCWVFLRSRRGHQARKDGMGGRSACSSKAAAYPRRGGPVIRRHPRRAAPRRHVGRLAEKSKAVRAASLES